MCPSPRCFTDDVTSCRLRLCSDANEEPACTSSSVGCSWDDSVFYCAEEGDVPPCNLYTQRTLCRQTGHCTYVQGPEGGGSCETADTGLACAAYATMSTCPPTRCYFNATTVSCADLPCNARVEREACLLAPPDILCAFDNATERCYINDLSRTCAEFSAGECPEPRCRLDGATGTTCTDQLCSAHEFNAELCNSLPGCNYLRFRCLQKAPCAEQSPDNCDTLPCELGSGGQCQARPCSEFDNSAEDCVQVGPGCAYDRVQFQCYEDDLLEACEGRGEEDCHAPRCYFDPLSVACRNMTCFDLSADDCAFSPAISCVMDERFSVCRPAAGEVACRYFDNEPELCLPGRCSFDAVGLTCQAHGKEG